MSSCRQITSSYICPHCVQGTAAASPPPPLALLAFRWMGYCKHASAPSSGEHPGVIRRGRRHRSTPSISGAFTGNLSGCNSSVPAHPPSGGMETAPTLRGDGDSQHPPSRRMETAIRCRLTAILHPSEKAQWEEASGPRTTALPSSRYPEHAPNREASPPTREHPTPGKRPRRCETLGNDM